MVKQRRNIHAFVVLAKTSYCKTENNSSLHPNILGRGDKEIKELDFVEKIGDEEAD